MKPFRKIYVEISNRCNLRCSFCPGTARPLGAMTEENFARLLPKLAPFTDFLYFHLMGEPLCHPQLERFLELAGEAGFRVILTTNGTLLSRMQEVLLAAPALHKVNISLQAFEGSGMAVDFDTYLAGCFGFGQAAAGKKIVCYRLWNRGGLDSCNPAILRVLESHFPKPWVQERRGIRLQNRVYLELGEKFDWPDLSAPQTAGEIHCYGLKDQLGILWDGTVVPCCLDHEGDIPLGNVFQQELSEILTSPRAQALKKGFQTGNPPEPLCRRCGYATRFSAAAAAGSAR